MPLFFGSIYSYGHSLFYNRFILFVFNSCLSSTPPIYLWCPSILISICHIFQTVLFQKSSEPMHFFTDTVCFTLVILLLLAPTFSSVQTLLVVVTGMPWFPKVCHQDLQHVNYRTFFTLYSVLAFRDVDSPTHTVGLFATMELIMTTSVGLVWHHVKGIQIHSVRV
jgi:hypothetical protein